MNTNLTGLRLFKKKVFGLWTKLDSGRIGRVKVDDARLKRMPIGSRCHFLMYLSGVLGKAVDSLYAKL